MRLPFEPYARGALPARPDHYVIVSAVNFLPAGVIFPLLK